VRVSWRSLVMTRYWVVGGSGLLLGLLTGSGVLALGSTGSAIEDGLGSSGVGWGSSGSALGSAAVGSAATGSALLTYLLLLPAPAPVPELPLRIPCRSVGCVRRH
jgi:hypothetical protein